MLSAIPPFARMWNASRAGCTMDGGSGKAPWGGRMGFSDFREGGLKGLKLLYAAGAALPLQGVALGRPVGFEYDAGKVSAILRASDGVAVSAYVDWPNDELEKIAEHVRPERKIF